MDPTQPRPNNSPLAATRRRVLLTAGGLTAAGLAGATAYVATHADHPLVTAQFSDIPTALRTLERLRSSTLHTRSGWDLAQVLHHAAQSIDFSIDGYPQVKPAWFRGTLGRAAFHVFSARGKMSHGLSEPIPGAPSIAPSQALGPAVESTIESLLRFDRHTGALQPHFAYGLLGKGDYARAHLMHLANHWDLVDAA